MDTGKISVAAARESLTRGVVVGLEGIEERVDRVIPSNSEASLEEEDMVADVSYQKLDMSGLLIISR